MPRAQHGLSNPAARIREEDIDLIFALRQSPYSLSPAQIAAKLDDYDPPISPHTVRDILRGRRRCRRG